MAGFSELEVCVLGSLNKCMIVKICFGGGEYRALLDTGCPFTLVYCDAWEKIKKECGEINVEQIHGVINGVGDVPVKALYEFSRAVKMQGLMMGESNFWVIDRVSGRYDIVLGYEFMKRNKLVLHPHVNMVERLDKQGVNACIYLNEDGSKKNIVMKGLKMVACADAVVGSTGPCFVSVKLKDQMEEYKDVMQGQLVLMNGKNAGYGVKRVGRVYDGVTDWDNLRVCVIGKVSKNGRKARGIRKGDVMCSVQTLVCESVGEGVEHQVNVGSMEDWTYERIRAELDIGEQLSEDEKEAVYRMCFERRKVLSRGDDDLEPSGLPEFRIILEDPTPIYQRPRHFSQPITEEIERQCEELERAGVLEPSESPWNSPIVPVRKPDGSLRLCVDYRKVNEKTVKDRFPMCLISDCVYGMHGMKLFTKMDLVRGYYQMPIEEGSRPVTAFSTARRHYQFKALSFGLANAPAAFQRAMTHVLSEFPKRNVLSFIDDILGMSVNVGEHLEVVNQILCSLEEHGVKVKPSKCEWFKEEVEFLGHKVCAKGISKSDKYVEKVQNFPRPSTVRELRAFLGLIEFQRKFIPGCSGIAAPLNEWTGKKGRTCVKWSEEMLEAFERVKEVVAKDVTLAYPDYSKEADPIELYTDASGFCMGGCLMQLQKINGESARRAIGYVSKAFNKAERNYSTIERELAAIRYCVKAFKSFLYGMKFVIKTDHQPLVYLNRMKNVDSRIARTLEDLSDFDYRIEYTPGDRNLVADMMSHLPVEIRVEEISDPHFLPPGLKVNKWKGKENDCDCSSLFDCVYEGLKDLDKRVKLKVKPPEDCKKLREKVMDEAIKRPELLGMKRCKRLMNELEVIRAGVHKSVYQEVLIIVSKLYGVSVYVYFGGHQPLIYRYENNSNRRSEMILHL